MKAAIYTRVSTDGQAEVEFNSCETQEIKIRSFISSQNDLEVHKVYSDQGYTGANTDRPALQEMIGDIQNGKINLVIAYKIDRLTRSPKDFYQLIEIFEQYNVSFISVTERFDTSTPSGRLLRNIMLTFAQFERELISERIKDKMFERAKKGFWCAGVTPFGYKRENKRLVIEPREADIIRTIFETFVSTGVLAEVYELLKKKKMFGRNGLPILKTCISYILRSTVYVGKVRHNGNFYKGLHEPLISEELFQEAQLLFKPLNKKSKVFNYTLFPGLVRCKECGSVMTSVFTNKFSNGKRVRYFYYRCTSIVKRDGSFCGIKQVSSDRLDSYIVDNLDKIAKNQQYLDSLIFMLNNQAKGRQIGVEPNGDGSFYTSERVREIIGKIVKASKLQGNVEKRSVIKRHIKALIYSKEAIEVSLLYSANDSPAFENGSKKKELSTEDHHSAAWVCRHPAPSRLDSAFKNEKGKLKTAEEKPCGTLVRNNNQLRHVGFEPTARCLRGSCSTN